MPQETVRNHYCLKGKRLFYWIAFAVLLLIAGSLTAFFLFPRTPSTAFVSLSLDTTTGSALQISSWTAATARLLITLSISNPNWVSISVNRVAFNATNPLYGNGTTPFASGIDAKGFVMPSRGDVNITVPFAVSYDSQMDPGLKFAGNVTGSCIQSAVGFGKGKNGFIADLVVQVEAVVIGVVKISETVYIQRNVAC
ncbi:hypothetical protein BDR26DRAFT_867728 [Obelidium mucronatum]|nr:hypothetical protein BDR26DRAFT_867728 [Obelidium mucronatum]